MAGLELEAEARSSLASFFSCFTTSCESTGSGIIEKTRRVNMDCSPGGKHHIMSVGYDSMACQRKSQLILMYLLSHNQDTLIFFLFLDDLLGRMARQGGFNINVLLLTLSSLGDPLITFHHRVQ
jgi:hypothetical protein